MEQSGGVGEWKISGGGVLQLLALTTTIFSNSVVRSSQLFKVQAPLLPSHPPPPPPLKPNFR